MEEEDLPTSSRLFSAVGHTITAAIFRAQDRSSLRVRCSSVREALKYMLTYIINNIHTLKSLGLVQCNVFEIKAAFI